MSLSASTSTYNTKNNKAGSQTEKRERKLTANFTFYAQFLFSFTLSQKYGLSLQSSSRPVRGEMDNMDRFFFCEYYGEYTYEKEGKNWQNMSILVTATV